MGWQYGQFTTRDLKYFDLAHAVAKVSSHPKAKIGSVIVQGTDVIAVAHNIEKSHPLQAKYNVHRNLKGKNHSHTHHLHAEMASLVRLNTPTDAFGGRIYVSRIKNGRIGMCRPCAACMMALKDFGIRDIYYTTDYGLVYENMWENLT